MKVKELIEELKSWNPEMEVAYRVPAGDYWNNELAYKVASITDATIKYSDYHRSDKIIDEPDAESALDKNTREVVLLDI